MLTVAGINVEKEAGERKDSPASDAFSVLYPIPLDNRNLSFIRSGEIYSIINPAKPNLHQQGVNHSHIIVLLLDFL